jgi:hypothetical protein
LLRRAGGKIYAVYVWSPDIVTHIASAQRMAEMHLIDYVPESWDEESWEEWDDALAQMLLEAHMIKYDELLPEAQIVDYMDHRRMEDRLSDKENSALIGCFETADDAIEHYQGSPRYNNPANTRNPARGPKRRKRKNNPGTTSALDLVKQLKF